MFGKKLKLSIAFLAVFFIALNAFFLFLFIDGGSRYNGIRLIAESQNLIFKKKLESALYTQQFDIAVNVLTNRYAYLKDLSPEKNSLSQDFIEDVETSFKKAVLDKNKALFIDLLNNISETYPSSYKIKLMLAESYGTKNEILAYQAIDDAINLLGASSEPYRLGMKFALLGKDAVRLKKYCSNYKLNKHGGLQFADMNANQMQELGLRRLSLSIDNGDQKFTIENNGLHLDENTQYPFSLPASINLNNPNIRIILPILPGFRISLTNISFFSNGSKALDLFDDDFILTSSDGYFLANGAVVSLITNKPHVLNLIFQENLILKNIDKIELVISANQQNTFSKDVCNIKFKEF